MLFILLRLIAVSSMLISTASCGSSDGQPEFDSWRASVDVEGVHDLAEALDERGVSYRIDEMGELTRISWNKEDDALVEELACDYLPPPPPLDRSVSMVSTALLDQLENALHEAHVSTERREYAGYQYLVWEKKDAPKVRSVYEEAFNQTLMVADPIVDGIHCEE